MDRLNIYEHNTVVYFYVLCLCSAYIFGIVLLLGLDSAVVSLPLSKSI